MQRSCQSLLASNHVAVVNIDPSGKQIMVSHKTCKQIRSVQVANALFEYAYPWTIYIAGMCRSEATGEYLKSVEVCPVGIHKVESLTEVIEHHYLELRATCNAQHLVASGWIAVPASTSLDEELAAKLFAMAGAWNQVKVA